MSEACVTWVAGSSPRVRGKRPHPMTGGRSTRLIPACAGKTFTRRICAAEIAAHPRVCGENQLGAAASCVGRGSSPRVRGKHAAQCSPDSEGGLIPACAGKTQDSSVPTYQAGAHPRVCGENPHASPAVRAWRGSSPRVRGKRQWVVAWGFRGGLIPACAGKTAWLTQTRPCLRAHPRVCGENRLKFVLGFMESGSSPRVRGKLIPPPKLIETTGLIPACAGKTI